MLAVINVALRRRIGGVGRARQQRAYLYASVTARNAVFKLKTNFVCFVVFLTHSSLSAKAGFCGFLHNG